VRRRRILLALAWLPCVLCAAGLLVSHREAVGATLQGYGGFLDAGGIYAAGPALWEDRTEAWRGRPAAPGESERVAGTTVQRWKPFRVLRMGLTSPGSHTIYFVPIWVPTLVLTVPAVWLTRRWRPPRAPGMCSTCGYDLRATPGRCPECGTVPPPSA
jgi:hypothetical protein